ncbi:MAG: tetratricopeptide repeat protein [Chloroflexia bacterium]
MDGHAASPGDHRNPLIALSWQDDERARSHLWTRIVQCAEDGTLADALDEATAVVADLALPATVAQRLTTLLLLLTQDEPPIQHALRLAIVAGRWGARVDAEGSPAVETTVALVQRAGDCATAADPAMFSEQITGLREGLAQYCDELGQRCYGVGAFEDADRAYGAALALVRLLDETEPGTYRPLLAEHLSNIAATRAALRDYAVAQDAGEEAVRLYRLLAADRRSEHRHGLGRALNNLGKVYLEQGDPRGVAAHRETFTIYRDLPGFPDLLLAMAAANLGAALAQHGEYADAITAYRGRSASPWEAGRGSGGKAAGPSRNVQQSRPRPQCARRVRRGPEGGRGGGQDQRAKWRPPRTDPRGEPRTLPE